MNHYHDTMIDLPSLGHGTIWTIGHSNRTAEEFTTLLKSFQIEWLIDIRRFPGSRLFPHFNKEALESYLLAHDIRYSHLQDLGGRRKARPDSRNTGWRVEAFRGYADYMETSSFKKAMEQLEQVAREKRTVYMCSEAVWWSCHRSLVSDYLKLKGWKVLHIMGQGEAQEHPYTSPASVVEGRLSYSDPQGTLRF